MWVVITRNSLHLEGSVDLPARSLEMRPWTAGGSVANQETAAEIRIQGEKPGRARAVVHGRRCRTSAASAASEPPQGYTSPPCR